MNLFFHEELRARCSEINDKENNPEMANKAADAYERILKYADLSRKEGLLALEDESSGLDLNDETQETFFTMISLVVDGTDTKIAEEIGMNMLASNKQSSYIGLINLLYIRGSLMIQGGDNPRVIKMVLRSMLPKTIIHELDLRECRNELPKAIEEAENEQEEIRKLCEDDSEIDENDHSVVNETAKALIMLSDIDMQRLLRDTDNHCTAVALKGLPGRARARIFNNMSSRLGAMVAEDMSMMVPVRIRDAEEYCVKIMKQLIKLEARCEIGEYDLSVLKVVIDIYDSAEKENKVLRDKYKDMKSIIDQIYSY